MASLQRYTDRRVLITGGGSGIGQACVLRILEEWRAGGGGRYQRTGLADTATRPATPPAG